MLINEALESDSLRERLFLETARMNPGRIDLATYRRAIKNATGANDYVDYYSASAYARGVHRVIESVAALLDAGHAAEVIELTGYALSQIEKSVGYIDDSDGHIGGGRKFPRSAPAKMIPKATAGVFASRASWKPSPVSPAT